MLSQIIFFVFFQMRDVFFCLKKIYFLRQCPKMKKKENVFSNHQVLISIVKNSWYFVMTMAKKDIVVENTIYILISILVTFHQTKRFIRSSEGHVGWRKYLFKKRATTWAYYSHLLLKSLILNEHSNLWWETNILALVVKETC